MDWTRRLKIIAGALRLDRAEVARAATLGGVPVSNSMARGWLASRDSARARPDGRIEGRDRAVTEREFDAFLAGLGPMLDEMERDPQ